MVQKYVESPDKKNYATGASNHKSPERIRTAGTPANIAWVSELICSQDDDPGTSKSLCEIQRETDMWSICSKPVVSREIWFQDIEQKPCERHFFQLIHYYKF